MSDWAAVFLGVMALTGLLQCAFVIVAALSLRNTGARVHELCSKFDAEIKPTLDDLRQSAANVRAISEAGREQAVRVEALLSNTIANIETTVESVRSLVAKPIESLSQVSAFWGGLRSGLETYRTAEPKRRAPRHRAEDSDEHLFIG